MFTWLLELFKMPETKHIKNTKDIDDVQTTVLHQNIIKKKHFLYKLFNLNSQIYNRDFEKGVINDVITSDVLELPDVDKVIFAEKIPYPDKSVSAFFLLGTLHHIKEPEKFFSEINRCMKPGAKIIMIEPANTLFSRFFFKYIHHEQFDEKKVDWKVDGKGRLGDANLAIPWIIFIRDREKFLKKYPELEILQIKKHTPFRWFLSGGFSYRQFVPSASFGLFTSIEKLLSPFSNTLGSFMTIVLKKSK